VFGLRLGELLVVVAVLVVLFVLLRRR